MREVMELECRIGCTAENYDAVRAEMLCKGWRMVDQHFSHLYLRWDLVFDCEVPTDISDV
jgi:hypothetical protein